jgi:hypothetical protein
MAGFRVAIVGAGGSVPVGYKTKQKQFDKNICITRCMAQRQLTVFFK